MNPKFRWLLHTAVEDNFSGLFTFSVGEEFFEQVVVCRLQAILLKIQSGECTHEKALCGARQKYGPLCEQHLTFSDHRDKNPYKLRMKTVQKLQAENVKTSRHESRSGVQNECRKMPRRPDIQLYVPRARRSVPSTDNSPLVPKAATPNTTPVQARVKHCRTSGLINVPSESRTAKCETENRRTSCLPIEVKDDLNEVHAIKQETSAHLSELCHNSSEVLIQDEHNMLKDLNEECASKQGTDIRLSEVLVQEEPNGSGESDSCEHITEDSDCSVLETDLLCDSLLSATPEVSDAPLSPVCKLPEHDSNSVLPVNQELRDEVTPTSSNVSNFCAKTEGKVLEVSSTSHEEHHVTNSENVDPEEMEVQTEIDPSSEAPGVQTETNLSSEALEVQTEMNLSSKLPEVQTEMNLSSKLPEVQTEMNLSSEPPVENTEGDSWDALFDENGDCLHPSVLQGLKAALGTVEVQKPKIDYLDFQPQVPDLNDECYGHILELYDFPVEFKTPNLMMAFSSFKDRGFDIKWVDDTHALAIFSSPVSASEALELQIPFIKTRPVSQAISKSKFVVAKKLDYLVPSRPRPETSASLARRMIAGALGMKSQMSKEQRENERRKLQAAKETKRQVAKQKQDVWNGTVS